MGHTCSSCVNNSPLLTTTYRVSEMNLKSFSTYYKLSTKLIEIWKEKIGEPTEMVTRE